MNNESQVTSHKSQQLKAIIFDFNGVIANDEPIHLKMFQKVLKSEGIRLSQKEYYKKYLAYDDRNCFEKILTAAKHSYSENKIRELIQKKTEYYKTYIQGNLVLFPGVKTQIRRLAKHYPLAIASAALKAEILWILNKEKLAHHFKVIVSAEDTRRSKPDPESYLLALKKLNQGRPVSSRSLKILPSECLVIEDSIHGIEGAHQASMKCVALEHTYRHSKLKAADLVFKDFREFSLKKILELFYK